jgi:hypothetical protein
VIKSGGIGAVIAAADKLGSKTVAAILPPKPPVLPRARVFTPAQLALHLGEPGPAEVEEPGRWIWNGGIRWAAVRPF